MSENIATRCAVCRLSDGLVVNTIVAVPGDIAPEGHQIIEIMNGQICDIGWYYDGLNFVDPNPPSEENIPFEEPFTSSEEDDPIPPDEAA